MAADVVRWDLLSAADLYEISGQITEDVVGLDDITVELTGDISTSAVTSGGGNYSFTVPDGSYTVTPSSVDYEFTPTSRNVTVSGTDVSGEDFTAQALIQVIVDNDDPEASVVGTWRTATEETDQKYGSDIRFKAGGTGSAKVRWTPTLAAGMYNVYAWWVDNDPAYRASNAPYTIHYSGDSETVVTVDQSTDGPGGGHWNLLGTYTFDAGTSGYVELSDNADNYVVADAVRWELQ